MKEYEINLNLFGEDGSGESGQEPAQEVEIPKYESSRRTKKTETKDDIKYGVQEGVVVDGQGSRANNGNVSVSSDTLDARKDAWNKAKEEYKDLFDKDFQGVFDRRFKNHKENEAKLAEVAPLLDILKGKYNVEKVSDIIEKLNNDDDYWYQDAEEKGMTVDQYKEFRKLEAENKRLLQEKSVERQNQFANQQVELWTQEAEELKALIPGFSLEEESQNKDFLTLLSKGIPMEQAYKVCHYDELMQQRENETAKMVTDNIRARGSRPTENGATGQSAFVIKDDVSKLSREDRRAIAERVARGEQIKF